MKRSLLLIVMTVGLVASFIGGASFAPFSDETTGTGEVTAGTLAFEGDGSQTFEFPTNDFCDEMAVGDTCTGTFEVTNSGTLTGWMDPPTAGVTGVTDPNEEDGECTEDMWDVTTSVVDEVYTESNGEFVEDDTHIVTVNVSLDENNEDINACQGATATVEVTVTVTQANEPHDDQDDGFNGL